MKIVAKLNTKFYITTLLLGALTLFTWYGIYFLNTNEILMEDNTPMTAGYKLFFTIVTSLIAFSWTVSLINMIRQIILGYAYTADRNGIYNTLSASIILAFIFVVPVKEIPRRAILKITETEDYSTVTEIDKSNIIISRIFKLFASRQYHFCRGYTKQSPCETAKLFKK